MLMSSERFAVDPAIKAFLHDLGLSPHAVLRRSHLPADLFARGPAMLTPDEYYRFWTALEDEAAGRNLAIEVGAAISVEVFSPPLLAALSSPNLEIAAARIAQFKPLIGPVHVDVSKGEEEVTITYRWPEHLRPPDLLAMSELVFWAALARIGTRHHVRPLRLTVRDLPVGHAELEQYFGARIARGAVYQIVFSAADAKRVFLTENETMWRFFAPELRKRLFDLDAQATVADRVSATLREMMPAGDTSMATVTNRMAISARTLQRQLKEENTSFNQVLASTREDLAKFYLTQGTLRTSEIAYLLAYEDTNSFYRAFRGWTGTTPDALRVTAPA